jgi:beta-lactamase regulating signal transducer with metallopeptidase domain
MTAWDPLLDRWFWVLVHSLWQASVVAVGLWLVLRTLPARSAERRYLIAVAAFVIAALCPLATWAWLGTPAERPLSAWGIATNQVDLPTGPEMQSATFPSSMASESPALSARAKSKGDLRSTAPQETRSPANSTAIPGPMSRPIPRSWSLTLLALWAVGAARQLVRTARDLSATKRLLSGELSCNSALIAALARATKRLGLRRRFEVLVGTDSAGPFVFGLWRPTLVLPAAVACGLPPEQLEAVLLHELAHLRRYDDVVNLIQRFVEALFFFNPALNWISSIVRREREAACDACAVASLGSPFSLAQALVHIAESAGRVASPQLAALNFAETTEHGVLLDRVRRMIRPDDRPHLRLSWPALLGAMLLLGLLCFTAERATIWSVALAKDWLSPEERIAAVAAMMKETGPVDQGSPGQKFRVTGTIRAADGSPLPDRPGHLYSISRQTIGGGSSSHSGTESAQGNLFDVSLLPGECWLLYYTDGFAPAFAGPFRGKGGEVQEGVEIVLKPGVSGSIRIVDQQGRPIPKASVVALPDWNTGMILGPAVPVSADENGQWNSEHLAETLYRLTIRAPGFSEYRAIKSQRITTDPVVIALVPAHVIPGSVVDSSGKVVAGARIGILSEQRPGHHTSHGGLGQLIAESDEHGTFQLADLSVETEYGLLVDAGDRGHALVPSIRADSPPVQVELQKKLTLSGEVRGKLSSTPENSPITIFCLSPTAGRHQGRSNSTKLDASGRFQFDSMFPGKYQLSIGRHVINGSLEESVADFVIDLDQLSKSSAARDVEIRFVEGGKPVKPGGTVGVQSEILDANDQKHWGGARGIVDGHVRLRVMTPQSVRITPSGCFGYWFDETNIEVPEGTGPFAAEIPVLPAGAIQVKVLTPEGKSDIGAFRRAGAQFSISTSDGVRSFSIDNSNSGSDVIMLSPIPLEAPCLVSASRQYRRVFSPELQLDGEAPVRTVTLALPRAVPAEFRVESVDGAPISRVPLEVNWSPPPRKESRPGQLSPGGMTWSSDQQLTDRDGRLTLEGFPAEELGFTVTALPLRDWQSAKAEIHTDGKPTVIRLEPGYVIEGRLVDETTKRGIPGINVRARLVMRDPHDSWDYPAEGPTDAEGRFRFSNLPPKEIELLSYEAQIRNSPKFEAGNAAPVVIEAKPH